MACEKIIFLYAIDNVFFNTGKKNEDIVKELSPKDVSPSVVVKHLALSTVAGDLEGCFNPLLDQRLTEFSWELAHSILYSGEKMKKWKI